MLYIYDGSFEGFLSCVFQIYERKDNVPHICRKEGQYLLFDESYHVQNNAAHALRVWNGLLKKVSRQAAYKFYTAFLKEDEHSESNLLGYFQYIFSNTKKSDDNYANHYVQRIEDDAKSVHREKHRMEAFVRFKLTADGIYYSAIEPDFNVLPLISKHFTRRYADQRWLIYDLKRKYGLYYDLEETSCVELELIEGIGDEKVFHADEEMYQHLWKDYFKSTNIPSRKNMKLHIRHVPLRYWRYLVEKKPLI